MKAGFEAAFMKEDLGYFDHDGLLQVLVDETTATGYVREVSVEGLNAGDRMGTIDGGLGIVASELVQHALLNLVELGSDVDGLRWYEWGVIAIVSGDCLISEVRFSSWSRNVEPFDPDGSTFDLIH